MEQCFPHGGTQSVVWLKQSQSSETRVWMKADKLFMHHLCRLLCVQLQDQRWCHRLESLEAEEAPETGLM